MERKAAFTLLISLVLISLLAAGIYADAKFGKPSIKLFSDKYGPNQPFSGYLNFSLKEVDSEGSLRIELRDGSSIKKDFPLLDLLDENSIPFTCSPESCMSSFKGSAPAQMKRINFDCSSMPCKKSEIGLVVESTSRIGDVVLDTVNFTMRGEALEGSYSTPFLDVGNDGEIDWLYLEPSNNFVAVPNNFDLNNKLGEKVFDGNWEYCQNTTLPAAKRFRFASSSLVDVPQVTFNLRSTHDRFPIQVLASCNATANAACTVNFTVTENDNFLLCALSSSGKIPYYGGGAKKGYFFNRAGDSGVGRQQYDFPLFASYAQFKQLDFTVALDEDEISAITEAMQFYLLDSCDHDAQECVVPLSFNSSTKGSVILENLKIVQSNWPPESNFYTIERKPAKLNTSSFVTIDLTALDLKTPLPSGYPDNFAKDWKIKATIEGESVSANFVIGKVPTVSLKPLTGAVGFPIRFNASASRGTSSVSPITSFEWDFGDGSEPVVTQVAYATYTYTAAGNYTLTLKATDTSGLTGFGTFTIRVGSSVGAVGSIISQRFIDFRSFQRSLPTLAFERNLILEALGMDEQTFSNSLISLNESYKRALFLPQAERDQQLSIILGQLADVSVPSKISDSFSFNAEFVPDVDVANPEYVNALSGEQALSNVDAKNAIALWQQEHVELSFSAKVKSAEFAEGPEPLFSIVKISLSPLTQDVSDYYLIISMPGTILASGGTYTSQELAPGVLGFTISAERDIVLAVDTTEFSEFKAFASPKLSELQFIEDICGDDICDAASGEDSSSCSLDCGRKIPGAAIFITILLSLLAAIVIFFIWRHYARDYKKRLFKSKRDHDSIMSFVEKGLVLKLPPESIKQKLRKAGWAEEQINYAIDEAIRVPEEKAGARESLGGKELSGEKPKKGLFSFGSKKKE